MKTIVAFLVLTLFATQAFAARDVMYGDTSDSALGISKYYLVVGGGEALTDTTAFSNGVKSTAYSIIGGYKINDNFGAELSYHNFGSIDALHDGSNVIKSSAYGLGVVGILPLNPAFSIYGSLGYSSTNYMIENAGVAGPSNSSGNIYYGFGSYFFPLTKHIDFSLGMNFYKLVDAGTNAMYTLSERTLGMRYQF